MTKKAKTKTKSDETPPKSAPSETQSTEPGAGPAADQKADAAAAPQPQPPTPAGAGPAPQPLTAAQPEAAKPQDSPAPSAAAPIPPLPDIKSGDSKDSEPPPVVAQLPAQLGPVGSPAEKYPADQLPTQLGVTGSPPGKPTSAPASPQLGPVGSPVEKSPSVQLPAQLGVTGSPPGKPIPVPTSPQLGPIGSPAEKSTTPAQLGVTGSPPGKPISVPTSPQFGPIGSPAEKSTTAQSPAQVGVTGSPPGKPIPVPASPQFGPIGSPAEKSPTAQLPAQLGVTGSPPGKPAPAPASPQLGPASPQLGPVGSPPEKSAAQLGVTGSPPGKPTPAPASPQLGSLGSPPEKSPAVQTPAQPEVVGPAPEKPPVAQTSPQLGAVGTIPEKSPVPQAPTEFGSPGEKPPAPKQDNSLNNEPKPKSPVESEPPKEQPTTPQPSSQQLPQPSVGDLSLSPTPSDKTREAPTDKSLTEKDSKPVAPPKPQDSKKELADKNRKVSPTSPKAAPGQPSKQPGEKQNKRQMGKENVQSNSTQKGEPSVNKPPGIDIKQKSEDKVLEKTEATSETKTVKDNTAAKVGDVAATQVKEEPNKNHLTGATPDTLNKQSSANETSKNVTDAEAPKPKDSDKAVAVGATEIKSAEKSETSKEPAADKKIAEQKVAPDQKTQGNQQKSSPKSEPSEKVNKNAPSKKNKQKNEAPGSKTEGAPNSKEVKASEKVGKKDTTAVATHAQPSPEVNGAPNLSTPTDSSKKPTSDSLPDTVSKLPTSETVASDHSDQIKADSSKLQQQAKSTTDSKDAKEAENKNDAQSKSSSKKKNRQQKKSASEDVKPSEANDTKQPQEGSKSKNNEKKKPAPASPSKEKESNRATASEPSEKNLKNTSGENVTSGPKVSPGKSPVAEKSPVSVTTNNSTAEKDSSDKSQVVTAESQSEEQGASKKKKRNRHKKKNKAADGDTSVDASVEGGKQQDAAVSSERKVKEKQQTTKPPTNKSKGQQKDSQPGQTKASKATQPVSTSTQDGQTSSETQKQQASETTGQTASAKKRNRRKKKAAAGVEKDSDASQSQESKSAESKVTPGAKAEEQKAKVDVPPTQTKTNETPKKKADSKPVHKLDTAQQLDGQCAEDIDLSENFVEVISKNKRNKKKKLDSIEPKIELSSFNDASKVVPENNVASSVSSSKDKMGIENVSGDSVKEATNKVAGPKISQEAREQKMLNKKLAERAQLKIQKQIESNALSEVEKSEKYLETITKNLRELTKLRSSRLEDVLQKGDEEEFDYEYTPVQRNTFLATTCHVCKESKPRETMKICEQCHLMSYCSEEHQKSDWSAHKDLCQAISDMCKERGTGHLYAPAVGLSPEEYRVYRMNALLECSAILNRQLEPYEQEVILYPNVCHTCHVPPAASLHTCELCSMVSYCSPEHRPPNHDVWCHDLQLYKSLIIYQSRNGVINPQLPTFLPESFQPLNGDMQSDLRKLSGGKDASPLERAVLSEIATGPLTALFALQKSNKVSGTTEKLVIHFVGAEWSFEMERADKWEAFLLHLIPSLKALVLVFVGPEVCNLPSEARGLLQKQSTPCPQCQQKGRTVQVVIPPQQFYHEYVASQDFIPPSLICAYNAGLYRPNGHRDVDSWSDTVVALLRDPGVPVAVTSYTAEEVLKDAERLQLHRPLNCVLPPSQNPYRSLRPNRNFASDDVTPVIFKNYYIMIATSLAQ